MVPRGDFQQLARLAEMNAPIRPFAGFPIFVGNVVSRTVHREPPSRPRCSWTRAGGGAKMRR
jgi:hypothetical protein